MSDLICLLILRAQFRCYGGTEILLHDVGAHYGPSSSLHITSVCGSSVNVMRHFLCWFRNVNQQPSGKLGLG